MSKIPASQLLRNLYRAIPDMHWKRGNKITNLRVIWRIYQRDGKEAALAEARARGVISYEETLAAREMFKRVIEENPKCVKCGSTKNLTADHVKPKSKFPELYAVESNIYVLCLDCNLAKGCRDERFYEEPLEFP